MIDATGKLRCDGCGARFVRIETPRGSVELPLCARCERVRAQQDEADLARMRRMEGLHGIGKAEGR